MFGKTRAGRWSRARRMWRHGGCVERIMDDLLIFEVQPPCVSRTGLTPSSSKCLKTTNPFRCLVDVFVQIWIQRLIPVESDVGPKIWKLQLPCSSCGEETSKLFQANGFGVNWSNFQDFISMSFHLFAKGSQDSFDPGFVHTQKAWDGYWKWDLLKCHRNNQPLQIPTFVPTAWPFLPSSLRGATGHPRDSRDVLCGAGQGQPGRITGSSPWRNSSRAFSEPWRV